MKNKFCKLRAIALTVAVMASVMSCKDKQVVPDTILSVIPQVTDIVFSSDGATATTLDGETIKPTFTVETNQSSWNITNNTTWVTTPRIGGNQFALVVSPAGIIPPEPAEIIITAGDATPFRIRVQQLGEGPTLIVTPEYRDIAFSFDGKTAISENGTFTPSFSVSTNETSWNAESDKSWLTVTEDHQNNTFTLTAAVNTGAEAFADAHVTVTAGDAPQVVITVKQIDYQIVACIQLDPLEKPFDRDAIYLFKENSDPAAAAKGETATFQFVLRSEHPISNLKITALPLTSGAEQIPATLKAFVRYSKINNPIYTPVYPEYPDCLWDEEYMDVPANKNQPVWVAYQIPRNAATGDYAATLVFTGVANGQAFELTKEVNAKVYPVIVPEQTLWVSNWMSYTSNMNKINGGVQVATNTPLFWDLVKVVANTARAHGQNTYNFWRELFSVTYSGNSVWSFDFSLFDELVETFIREGGLKRIEIGPVSEPMPAGFSVYVPGIGFCLWNDPNTESYLSQYLPALYNHLESKGWKDMTYQHIGDEPNDANAGPGSWNRVANLVKTIRPDIKIIEAVSATSISAHMDVWVPLLDYWGKNYSFYQTQQQTLGKEVWFYTCATPQGAYANRFMETPALRTRYLHWLNYHYGATGYLHWGFNFWTANMTIEHIANSWPAGDEFVVYPGYRKLYASIRLTTQRDGIADYELLKLLEKKDPSKAQELSARLIKGFDNYDENIDNFRTTRRELLEALSE